MEATIVTKSEFGSEALLRLDAEYVSESATSIEVSLQRAGAEKVGDLINDGPGRDVLNDGFADQEDVVSYIDLDAVDTTDGMIFPELIAYGERPSRAKHVLRVGDVLVGNVRPERGILAITSDRFEGSLASSGFTLLEIRAESPVNREFVYAFLRTRFGRGQLVRRARGSMYPAVLGRDVLDVRVPRPPKKLGSRVTDRIREVGLVQERFMERLAGCERMMEASLKQYGELPAMYDSPGSGLATRLVHRSDCLVPDSAERIDAEFFRSEYETFAASVEASGESFRLGERYELQPGRLSNGDRDEVPTLKQAVLTNSGINWSAVAFEQGVCSGPKVLDGDILLAATAHEPAYVAKKVDVVRSVPGEYRDCNQAVADLLILRPKNSGPDDVPGEYVAAFLRHACGRHQVQRCIRGLRGGHVYARDLARHVVVPVPPAGWLKEFEDSWEDAEAARSKAKSLVAESVRDIEAWVERDILNLVH